MTVHSQPESSMLDRSIRLTSLWSSTSKILGLAIVSHCSTGAGLSHQSSGTGPIPARWGKTNCTLVVPGTMVIPVVILV